MQNPKYEKTIKIVWKVMIYTFLVVGAISVLFPFYWMILTSLKETAKYNAETVPQFFAMPITFDNYVTAFTQVKLFDYLINTAVYAMVTTSLMIIVSTLAAFAFARINFTGKNIVFTIYLAMMMIPNELVIITNYTTAVNMGWRNSFTGLVLPSVLSIFYIYLLRDNFMQVSDNIYYAAKVDGSSDFNYLIKVLIPLSKPTIVSIAILKIIECWNSFVWPRLVTSSKEFYLVSQGIEQIKSAGFGRADVPAMMGAVVIISLPLLILFIIFRKQIMSGVVRSGTKG